MHLSFCVPSRALAVGMKDGSAYFEEGRGLGAQTLIIHRMSGI